MRRQARWLCGAALAAAVACRAEPPEESLPRPAPLAAHVPAASAPWLGAGAPTQQVGRGFAPLLLRSLPITASEPRWAPLGAPLVWQVPDARPALAVVSGSDGAGQVTELVEIDAGVVRWRVAEPSGPVVGVTATAIIGADRGTWALALDGGALWHTESPFLAMADEVVVVAAAQGRAAVIDAASGKEILRLALPEPLDAADVRWACPKEAAVYAIDARSVLHRVVAGELEAAPHGRVAWSAEAELAAVEGCGGSVLAATVPDAEGRYALLRLDAASGAVRARLDGVIAHWRDELGAVFTSQGHTSAAPLGVRRWNATLTESERWAPAALGSRLASRGDWHLARGAHGGQTSALHASGGLETLALIADSAALGERAVLTAISSASSAHTLARWELPAPPAVRHVPEVPPLLGAWARQAAPVLPPATLRVLAEPAPEPHSGERAIAGAAELAAVAALEDGVVALLRSARGVTLARLGPDGAARWAVAGACAGESVTVAAHGALVACAARREAGLGELAVHDAATGALRWSRALWADAVQVLEPWILVRSGDRAMLLRGDGLEVASWHSGTGGAPMATLIASGGAVLLVAVEGRYLVGRYPAAGLLPLWSVALAGAVRELAPLAGHALVHLHDGEAYVLAGIDGAAAAMPREATRLYGIGEGVLAVTEQAPSAPTRLALFSLAGAVLWEYDVALPGKVSVLPSIALGASAIAFGEELERALELSSEGLGRVRALPESAASAAWRRLPARAGGRWLGLSTTSPRAWAF